MEFFTLNDGIKVPVLCFGPGMLNRGFKPKHGFFGKISNRIWKYNNERSYINALCSAIDSGARFFDTSAVYGNEALIAEAIEKTGCDRKDFILTTRVSNTAQFQGNVRDVILKSVAKFKTDYVDLLMFHWPVTDKFVTTYNELIKLKDEGVCRSIGVANCHEHHLKLLIESTGVIPSINQVEVHPLLSQKALIKFCNDYGIRVEAYTPLARMDERMTRLPLLKEISLKYEKTLSQVILRWHIQNGVIPVFRSLNADRQKENFDVFDFVLDAEDMKKIDGININSRLRYDPDNCDFTIL